MGSLIVATFDNDAVIFEIAFSDVNLKISDIICNNNSPYSVRGTLLDWEDDSFVAHQTFLTGITEVGVVGNHRIEFLPPDPETPDSPGGILLPYKTFFEYPAP